MPPPPATNNVEGQPASHLISLLTVQEITDYVSRLDANRISEYYNIPSEILFWQAPKSRYLEAMSIQNLIRFGIDTRSRSTWAKEYQIEFVDQDVELERIISLFFFASNNRNTNRGYTNDVFWLL